MKKLIFSLILAAGFAFAANAQTANTTSGAVNVQSGGQMVSKSDATKSESPAKVEESHSSKSCCSSKNASSNKKGCCADGKKSASCKDMKKEEKESEK